MLMLDIIVAAIKKQLKPLSYAFRLPPRIEKADELSENITEEAQPTPVMDTKNYVHGLVGVQHGGVHHAAAYISEIRYKSE